jgi:sugar phosphate isomerase/epimerase
MTPKLFFKISLAQWSLHRALFAREMDNLDFPAVAKNQFGIDAVEYVNQFFMDKATDMRYLIELKKHADDVGVTNVLIMCDGEGELASPDDTQRAKSIDNHFKWIDAAKFLGCSGVRVNCFGQGSAEEMAQASMESLRKLCEYARPMGINVMVENHGGFSSNGLWLSNVISNVRMDNCGTLPDFGNFCIRHETPGVWETPCLEAYDRYKGVAELMPHAKGVSAKAMDFDGEGNCAETNYERMISIVRESGYVGYVGIEYAGSALSEAEGIRATKMLLERVGRAV